MDDLYTLVFGICAALLAIEILSRLFPEKSGELVRGLVVLCVLAVLFSGIMKIDFELDFSTPQLSLSEEGSFEMLAAKSGIDLLRERLCALLEAAGIETAAGADSIEIRYRQDDTGAVEIDRVCVQVRYGTDTERVFALLRNVLTEAIPVEIRTK